MSDERLPGLAPPKPAPLPPELNSDDGLIGTLIAERYRVHAKIGEGGMGAVYRGEHVLMSKPVAIKILHRDMELVAEALKRFEREAVAAGRLSHPNVASATDFGRLPDGAYYLVLEYVPGQSLESVLSRDGALPQQLAVSIARQVASAMSAAHAEDIVHRDLKPDNIMLVERATGDVHVKVLDFGIAKLKTADDTELTQAGSIFGTPRYMSPEQAAGKTVDHRADLYALGTILFEMLSGSPPFEHDQAVVLLAKHMNQPPPVLPAHIPRPVRELVQQLLAKAPGDRPGTANEVMERLDALSQAAAVASTTLPDAYHTLQQRIDQVKHRLLAAWRQLSPQLKRVAVASHHRRIRGVPLWGVGLAGTIAGSLFLGFLNDSDEPSEGESSKASPTAAERPQTSVATVGSAPRSLDSDDPELRRMIALAKRGSPAALFALEQRKPNGASATESLALAIGRLRARQPLEALEAAQAAITQDPKAAADRDLLGGLAYFGARDEHPKAILEFSAESLGRRGADLLFHVWSSTSRKTIATQTAWKLLQRPTVQQNMSKALKLALELRAAESCEAKRALLPRLELEGDERVMVPMRAMAKKTGCGNAKRDDCFPCLRQGDQFKDAFTQVAMRNGPRFEWER